MKLYPLKFKPVYKDYVWGGDRIIKKYNRDEPSGVYAESWEVSARAEGMSVVANGVFAGKSLVEMIKIFGTDLLGTSVTDGKFPLLIKLIDSRQRLSVQVHPDDDNARFAGGEPKTEMWYILDADAGAEVVAGLKPGVDEERLRQALRDGDVPDILNHVPISAGDAIYMPGGRVHSICEGSLILEVQQNSNTTYRLYDWERIGIDGKPRELHVNEALKAIKWGDAYKSRIYPDPPQMLGRNEFRTVVKSPYFMMEWQCLREKHKETMSGEAFAVFFCDSGRAEIEWAGGKMAFAPGTTVLLPATLPVCEITPVEPECHVLKISSGLRAV